MLDQTFLYFVFILNTDLYLNIYNGHMNHCSTVVNNTMNENSLKKGNLGGGEFLSMYINCV